MIRLREWLHRLWGTFRAPGRDRDLEEELRLHVDLAAEAARHGGRSAESARRAAALQTGGLTQAVEAVRDQRGLPWLDDALRDVRYAVRLLRRHPGFTTVAVLTLAIGIGVNTAVFTAYTAMLARRLDARDPGTMVNLALTHPSGRTHFLFSYPDYEAYRDSARSFSGLVAYSPQQLTLSGAGGALGPRVPIADSGAGKLGLLSGTSNAEFASTYVVSDNYFAVLGVAAAAGRTFDAIDPREMLASPPVLMSENYWRRRFNADPSVLGRALRLNGAAVTVVGITPRDFIGTGVAVPAFWLPISVTPLVHADDAYLRDRDNERWRLFGRLAPGVSLPQARAELAGLTDRLRALHDPHAESAQPSTALVWPGSPFPLPLELYPGLRFTVVLIMVAAAMVLVVACANTGSLQLARARSRQSEFHTRLSLGASRGRVLKQLLTESALLGVLAGGTALLFTWMFLRALVGVVGDALPAEFGTLIFNVTPDGTIFLYVLAVALGAGILFGLAPSIESSRAALTSTSRTGTSSRRSRRIQDALVAVQVALSLVLLIAGSLLTRSALRAVSVDPGYEHRHAIELDVQFPEASKYGAGREDAIVRELRARLAALPGVTAVTSGRPPSDDRFRTAVLPSEAASSTLSATSPMVFPYRYVEANFFQTLGIPLTRGSGFQSDASQAEGVVVSESAAALLWPGRNPIGRTLRMGADDEQFHTDGSTLRADGPAHVVIGVAGDTRGDQFDGSDSRVVYLPLPADQVRSHPILLRTPADPGDVRRAIDPVVASVDPNLLVKTNTLDALLRQALPFVVSMLAAVVASSVGLVGLLLAAIGIYGTVGHIVVLRTREVGIRLAVGAQARDVLGLILGESTRPVFAGLAAGLMLAVGVSFLLRSVLYGVSRIDAISFAGVSLFLLVIALVAAYIPARRALRVDPTLALRQE